MGNVDIKLDHGGMAALLKSDGVRSELTKRAGSVLAAAQASAPTETGSYRESLHIIQDTTDRAVVRIGSSAPHAFAVEAATGNLARAVDAAGGS